jgi:hypothetical protein
MSSDKAQERAETTVRHAEIDGLLKIKATCRNAVVVRLAEQFREVEREATEHAITAFEAKVAVRLREVERERDAQWRKAAESHFDGIQPNEKLASQYEGGMNALPDAIIHEIWKRDPQLRAIVAAGDALKTLALTEDKDLALHDLDVATKAWDAATKEARR